MTFTRAQAAAAVAHAMRHGSAQIVDERGEVVTVISIPKAAETCPTCGQAVAPSPPASTAPERTSTARWTGWRSGC